MLLLLVVLMPLLLSQVFVFSRLKTHGDHLRASQHLAALPGEAVGWGWGDFLPSSQIQSGSCRRGTVRFDSGAGEPMSLPGCVYQDDGVGPVIGSLPSACTTAASSPASSRPAAAIHKKKKKSLEEKHHLLVELGTVF